MPGPFYFAWVDPDETAFAPAHAREDEQVFGVSIDHAEGQFPTLSLEIRNPGVGLLAPGRKIWAWLSWFNGSAVVPLFFGRLVGVPADILGEAVTLVFNARPIDYAAQKNAVADGLRALPFYDPVFVDPAKRADPDAVLEGYSARWHVDRTTLAVSASDILVGEDGLEVFTEDDVFYDSVAVKLGQPPLAAVTVVADVAWTQSPAAGTIDFGARSFASFTGGSLLSSWPKSGDQLAGGWSVAAASAIDVSNTENASSVTTQASWQNREKEHEDGDTMSISVSLTTPTHGGFSISGSEEVQTGFLDPETGKNIPAKSKRTGKIVVGWLINTTLTLAYQPSVARSEQLAFTLTADLQPILTLPEDSPTVTDQETVTLSGTDVGTAIDGDVPIGDVARGSYFPTDRGLSSVEYLIAVARAHLRNRARAVEVSWECRFERALSLSCRKSARIYDHRLPGGTARGKIIAYSIKAAGDGKLVGGVTIGCAVGLGNAVVAAAGDPSYAELGYVDTGYQYYDGAVALLGSLDVGYTPPLDAGNDGSLHFPLSRRDVVVTEAVHGTLVEQQAALQAAAVYIGALERSADEGDPRGRPALEAMAKAAGAASVDDALKDHPIWYELVLRPVSGEKFASSYDIATTPLVVPTQIDLEAPSSP
jgi:hypothetical protein